MVMLFAMAMMSSLFLSPTANAVSQTWYLTDIPAGDALMMNKRGPVTVEEEALWRSDETGPMKFPGGEWNGELQRQSAADEASGVIAIGIWDGGTFYTEGKAKFLSGKGENKTKFSMESEDFIVPEGQWLGFMMTEVTAEMVILEEGVLLYPLMGNPGISAMFLTGKFT